MKIGIDIGWTIKGVRSENDRSKIAPESFRIIKNMIDKGHEVYLISKVNDAQRARTFEWLKDTKILENTGIKEENLFFCFERKDKSIFVRGLSIQIMIDDRAEVMAYLDPHVIKFLLDPEDDDLDRYENVLINTTIVKNWLEIESHLKKI
jgi:hypothetical protein